MFFRYFYPRNPNRKGTSLRHFTNQAEASTHSLCQLFCNIQPETNSVFPAVPGSIAPFKAFKDFILLFFSYSNSTVCHSYLQKGISIFCCFFYTQLHKAFICVFHRIFQ